MRHQTSILAAGLASVFLTASVHAEETAQQQQEELTAGDVRIEPMRGKKVERHPYLFIDWVRHGFDVRNDFRIERMHFKGVDGQDSFADIFIPEGDGPYTVVMIVPPLNKRDPSEKLAKDFARNGIMAVHMAHVPLDFDKAERPEDPSNAFRLALENTQIATGYVMTRADVDLENVGVVGISMGGIIGARDLAEDERLKFGAFGLAGANLGPAMADSSILDNFIERMKEQFKITTREEVIALLRPHTDPIDPMFNTREMKDCVLVMVAEEDTVVTPDRGIDLSVAFGGAEVKMNPYGHFSMRGAQDISAWMVNHTKAVSAGVKCTDEPAIRVADMTPLR